MLEIRSLEPNMFVIKLFFHRECFRFVIYMNRDWIREKLAEIYAVVLFRATERSDGGWGHRRKA